MPELFNINPELNVPIYQQLVDVIRTNIKTGKLEKGAQLPTVRDLAEHLDIARGTVKKTYDELEQEKLVEKVQGRGTFVCYTPLDRNSRKDRAMAAIDRMLDEMEELELSMSEVNIFLSLKLREREAAREALKVAVVECCPETVSQITEQLREIEGLDIYSYLLSDVKAYPYKLSEEMSIIVTSEEHARELQDLISQPRKIARVALRLSTESVSGILKLSAADRVAILAESPRFAFLMQGIFSEYSDVTEEPLVLVRPEDPAEYAALAERTAVLYPKGYERRPDAAAGEIIFGKDSGLRRVPCYYRIDEGSLLYLKERIERLR